MTTLVIVLAVIVLLVLARRFLQDYIDIEIEQQLDSRLDQEARYRQSVGEIKDEMRRASSEMISVALEPRRKDSVDQFQRRR